MPPHKGPGRGIVKSGNTGNSTKASSAKTFEDIAKEKPLFPPGSKFPLSLLNERCQKNGWERPEVSTRPHATNGHSFTVILRRQNKKTSQMDSVKLEPHPPFYMPSALEARHWGATYALYRVCNNIQLNRVLPPGPREYWAQLEQEHKTAPEHLKWMYNPDPFSAKKEVEARQEAATKRREDGPSNSQKSSSDFGAVGNEFVGAVEVKMSSSLRELVESSIKKAYEARTPTAAETQSMTTLPHDSYQSVSESLKLLSFTPAQITRTLRALNTTSPLTTSLLSSSPNPLDAAISHLLLCVPECDLPPRFLARGAGESFVQSAHKGTDDIKTRWLLERAVKEAGYPEQIVKSVLFPVNSNSPIAAPTMDWAALLDTLGKKLVDDDTNKGAASIDFDAEERDFQLASEIAALESVYPSVAVIDVDALGDTPEILKTIDIPVSNTPVTLHIVLRDGDSYPLSTSLPPMYISATNASASTVSSTPPYIRLHLLSTVFNSPMIKERGDGEGIGLVAAGVIEEEWDRIQSEGAPDVADVLQHLFTMYRVLPETPYELPPAMEQPLRVKKGKQRSGDGRLSQSRDDRSDAQILADFTNIQKSANYQTLLKDRSKLPAWNAKQTFLDAFKNNRVVVCVGETGSGKTTQIPQYILDEYIVSSATARGPGKVTLSDIQIIITQPRRVAAISVAARVATERADDGSVAYAIRGESTASRRTKLLFCTTGVVLRRLTAGDGLKDVGVIIVDEVHERSVDSDFLLLELKELMKKDKALKIVLMSATINQKTFVDYFDGAALVEIPGRTFPVQDSYLEDIMPHISYAPSFSKPAQKQTATEIESLRQMHRSQGLDEASIRSIEIVTRSERIDYQLVAATTAYIIAKKGPGAILIFMPGAQEIKQCIQALKSSSFGGSTEIFPLHANLSSEEQKAVFRTTGKRKIVVSTNVAETSITIDDVVYVIDTGKVKETSYDPETGISRLTETWVTKAAGRQRKGRAGRTRPGECYKLYTKKQEQDMTDYPVPEILRVPLESLSLAVKAVREDEDVKLFLAKAIDSPPIAAMEKAWSVLQELGAINGDGQLTPLGRHMSLLPVDLRLGKMLILGSIFRCLEPILTVAACLSSKPLFSSPLEKREEATRARARFSSANSDLLTDAHAYEACMKIFAERGNQAMFDFCRENFISHATVRDITSLREDLSSALLSAGFTSHSSGSSSSHPALVKSIIMAGLYPRVARISLPSSAIKFDKVQSGTVQREQEAKEFKIFDLEQDGEHGKGQRVFLHPSSVLFEQDKWKEPFLCYFRKVVTTKPFLRDATEVPLFALLLFGGPISINHVAGGLSIGGPGKTVRIKMKAWPRIGVLANQLRQLLDEHLAVALETASLDMFVNGNPVLEAILSLLTKEGFSL